MRHSDFNNDNPRSSFPKITYQRLRNLSGWCYQGADVGWSLLLNRVPPHCRVMFVWLRCCRNRQELWRTWKEIWTRLLVILTFADEWPSYVANKRGFTLFFVNIFRRRLLDHGHVGAALCCLLLSSNIQHSDT